MEIEFMVTEKIYDSYIDLLQMAFLNEGSYTYLTLFNGLIIFIDVNRYYILQTSVCQELSLIKAKHSYYIDKNVVAVGMDLNFIEYYFLGFDNYKELVKNEVLFNPIIWFSRLNTHTTQLVKDKNKKLINLFDYIEKDILIDNNKIKPNTLLKKTEEGYTLKKFETDDLISCFKNELHQSKMHN